MTTSFKQMLRAFLPLIKNTSSTIIIRGLSGIVRIFVLLLITRQFGPAEFGRLALVISVTEIFKVMADIGLDTISIRRFSLHRRLSPRIMDVVLTLKLMTATAGYLLSLIIFWTLYHSTSGVILLSICALSIYTNLLINAFSSYFQATLKISDIIGSTIIGTTSYIILTLICLYYHLAIEMFALAIPAGEMVTLVLTLKVYRTIHPIRFRFNRKIAMSLFRESIPAGLSALIVVVYLKLDNVLIGKIIGEQGVGEYAVAYRLTEPMLLIFSSLSISLYASLSKYRNAYDLSAAKAFFIKLLKPVIISGLGIAVLFSIFSGPITSIFSNSYKSTAFVLEILSWSILFKAINPQLSAFITARGKYRLMMTISATNLVVNIAANLTLIPIYGIRGAAMAVVITEGFNTAVQSTAVYFLSRQYTPGSGAEDDVL
jgi:O-antigen/teichoic acid export membrane protein